MQFVGIAKLQVGADAHSTVYLAGRERICEGMRMAGVPEG
jgi:hypothetical protein